MAVARTVWDFFERRDLRLMRRVNRWKAPRFIRIWMILMTRLGDGLLWYALALGVLLCGGPRKLHALLAGAAAAFACILLFKRIKKLSRRKRPCQIEPHCWSLITPPDQFSFPSGHTMTAFAIAVSVGTFYPEFQAALVFAAVTIAISRIILGMHFLTDVLVGMLLGIGIGLGSARIPW